ncbi:MAG: hypothetical protein OEZ39_06850 [Gammaproteobacteria bacterium]|nr:hypothetical protein [Gammaproteobacteria bacterium]MDH5651574.1 hypothetical protein [Gammaproteobacteria bacterium]
MSETPDKLQHAELILRDYGKVLSTITAMGYAHPVSLLPHTKDQIKDAIQALLTELGDADGRLRDSLFEAYVLLAKFIPDEDVATLENGQSIMAKRESSDTDLETADRAAKLINSIKLEMEALTADLTIFLK